MTVTTYYYPSEYGSGAFAANGRKGTANFHGQAQEPAGSYTVVSVNSKTPNVYKIILGYTGKGTGTKDTVYQTKFSTKSLNEVSDGTYDFILSNKAVAADFSHHFTGKSQAFQANPAFEKDPTRSSHASALSHSLFEAAFAPSSATTSAPVSHHAGQDAFALAAHEAGWSSLRSAIHGHG